MPDAASSGGPDYQGALEGLVEALKLVNVGALPDEALDAIMFARQVLKEGVSDGA